MKRYRYILAKCDPSEPIWKYRLVSSAYIGSVAREPGRVYIRVWIPDDTKLKRSIEGRWSTTNDERTIEELGYDLIMTTWTNRRRVISKDADIEKLTKEEQRKYFASMFGSREGRLREVVA